MKNNASLVYSVFLILGDFVALVAAFTVAYVLRVTLDHTQISAHIEALTYIGILATLLPFFIIIFGLLGLYSARVLGNRFAELGRLAIVCFVGILGVISYSYIANVRIFPARLVTLYGFLLALCFVLLFRTIARGIRRLLFKYGVGIANVLIVGDTPLTLELIRLLADTAATGYNVAGVVGSDDFRPAKSAHIACFDTFDDAVARLGGELTTIVQTELYASGSRNDHILVYAQEHHLDYRFVPGNSELFVGKIEAELFHSVPVIAVHQTALIGWGRVVKRLTDLVLSTVAIIVASPIMLLTAIAIKLDGGGSVFFRQTRLTRDDKPFRVFKFRSQYPQYDGTTPEQAFALMGKPDLGVQYRANGDMLPDDPRITRVGRVIRRLSIDELPQLFNVFLGDISLVGPRALIPQELAAYKKRHAILSVKSGITGLAQVSGRRNISFDERRQLDLYYVQNWSFWGDLVIMARTVSAVLMQRGAE
ncbi:MAG TPA: sugar transferase [Candidatus Saccharimonadales bacterium]|nr:sugar transferase [Candidatus Saccharimonadales bacterium]